MEKIQFVSLFSGGMGLDLGLESAGFHPVVCNEIDAAAVKTIRRNRPLVPVVTSTISELTGESLGSAAGRSLYEVPLIAGGPPCQSFSSYGKRRGTKDSRGKLIYDFIRVVRELKPKVFLMENVRGLHSMAVTPKASLAEDPRVDSTSTKHGSLLRDIFRSFESIGYRVDCFIVNSVNYGAPQVRERIICIGNRFGLTADFPEPRFSNRIEDRLPVFRTLGDAIGPGFIDPDSDCMDFSPRKLKYLAEVPAGGNWRSLPIAIQKESMGKSWYLKGGRSAYWRKLSFEFPSPTVVTMPNHAGTSMCHPTELRALTVGELAAIQEFPDLWHFEGSVSDKCRQIGNAVPIRLGKVAGSVIRELLGRIESGKEEQLKLPSRIIHLRPHVRTRTFFKSGQSFAGDHSYYEDEDQDQ